MTSGRAKRIGAVGCAVALGAASWGVLVPRGDGAPRAGASPAVGAAPTSHREPSLTPPPAAKIAMASAGAAEDSLAAVASATWAALPSSRDEAAPDADEVMARELLGTQLVTWLGEEVDPDAALVWADQIGELAPWLKREDRARLLSMARDDALEGRRQAAFVAMGRVAAVDPSLVDALARAYAERPSAEARAGLEEVAVALRADGVDVAPLERALRR